MSKTFTYTRVNSVVIKKLEPILIRINLIFVTQKLSYIQ